MYIYAFGSICRGEIDCNSDVDLLAIVSNNEVNNFNPHIYSIYSQDKIQEFWDNGNSFAWHLYYESKLIFSTKKMDYIYSLGIPKKYSQYKVDCYKFYQIFEHSVQSMLESQFSNLFDLSTIFLSIRNIATCFSFIKFDKPIFTRNSAIKLNTFSLNIDKESYTILEKSRILCTRGIGDYISNKDIKKAINSFDVIRKWMQLLLKEVNNYE